MKSSRTVRGQVRRAGVRPLRIVAIGGGTGLSALLRGLKGHAVTAASWTPPPVDITAVVTVTDDGGSSGRLRREFDVLPPGDIRNCLVALSEDEAQMSRLFQYRFAAGRGLRGHSFGNLFLAALANVTGDFAQAVRVSSEVLAVAGRIFPSTAANVALEATLEDGTKVTGETRISKSRQRIRRIALKPGGSRPLRETLEAIARADLITLGPGSLYTSVIPNLLVEGIPAALRKSAAAKAYVVNLMWQPGETMGYSASDHVRAILAHSCPGLLDYAVVNTRPIRPALRRKYARQMAQPVAMDTARLRELGLQVIEADLAGQEAVVRHDPAALAAALIGLAQAKRGRPQPRAR
ncbi:MAG: YvcK family protein [Bryobacterales bacterium]|nr:YvcK family protein [Bryobacterales bacterium]